MLDNEFTDEQIAAIWKRVLASADDPSAALKILLFGGLPPIEEDAPSDQLFTYRPGAQEEPGEYNVYMNIENAAYARDNTQTVSTPETPNMPNTPDTADTIDTLDTAGSTPPQPLLKDDDPDLDLSVRNLIWSQLEQSRSLRSMARAAANRRIAKALSLAANRNYSAAKTLASAYLTHTGLYFFPRSDRMSSNVSYDSAELRAAWKNEVTFTSVCADAAEKTEDVSLMKALLAAARAHAENAADIRRMITQFAENRRLGMQASD